MPSPETADVALFSLADAKAYLRIPVGNEHDNQLVLMVNGVSARLEALTRRIFVGRSADDLGTLVTSGRGMDHLILPFFPVTVEAIQTRESVGDTFSALTVNTDYEVDEANGIIYLVGQTFPRGPMTASIDYGAGYDGRAGVPQDIVQLAGEYLKFVYDRWSANLIATASQSVSGSSASVVPAPPKDLMDQITLLKKRRL